MSGSTCRDTKSASHTFLSFNVLSLAKMSSNGSSGGVANLSLAEATTMAASQAVAWFAAMEVMLVTFTTFKKWRGLYFWSLNISALGILIKCVTNITRFFAIITPPIIPVAINEPAWVMMVTGQSLVLYSRLHLVIRDPRKLRWVLYMIIANGLILHVPTAVFTCGVRCPNRKVGKHLTDKFNSLIRLLPPFTFHSIIFTRKFKSPDFLFRSLSSPSFTSIKPEKWFRTVYS